MSVASSPIGYKTQDMLLGDIEATARRLRVAHELELRTRVVLGTAFSSAVARGGGVIHRCIHQRSMTVAMRKSKLRWSLLGTF